MRSNTTESVPGLSPFDGMPEVPAMQRVLHRTALANAVAPEFLEYLGMQDERSTVGEVLYHFNIQDVRHPRYRSTVTFTIAVPTHRKPEA